MLQNQFQEGKLLGSKHLSVIAAKGKKWKERNVPAFIRQHLLVPFYTTESDGFEILYVIQSPLTIDEKVHFIAFARRPLLDEGTSQIPVRQQHGSTSG